MIALMKLYLCICLLAAFFMCCSFSMNQEDKSEPPLHAPGAPTLITVRARNPSPKSAHKVALEVQSPFHSADSITNGQTPSDDAERKHMCEVRVSCCQKIIKCSGFTLIAALVVTTGGVAYYLKSLANTCNELITPVSQIRDFAAQGIILIKQGLALGQDAISLANQTFSYIRVEGSGLVSLVNSTQLTCQNAHVMCQNAQSSCNRL